MKLSSLFFILLIASNSMAFASHHAPSPFRYEDESFVDAMLRSLPYDEDGLPIIEDDSALDAALPFEDLNYDDITAAWNGFDVQANFEAVRDARFLADYTHPDFKRRISWLYPDDGCWLRAAVANQKWAELKVMRPNKVFIFGELEVKTKYSPNGAVQWWYHVAPIVMSAETEYDTEVYVLDPALNPSHPLPLKEWILLQTDDISKVTIALCNTYTFGPGSSCYNPDKNQEKGADQNIKNYLGAEWARIEELGLDPVNELGDNPPWL